MLLLHRYEAADISSMTGIVAGCKKEKKRGFSLCHKKKLKLCSCSAVALQGHTLPAGGRVLDLACGPGGWAIEVAAAFHAVEVVGIDLSARAVERATARARERGLTNVRFQTMNIMEALAFPNASFDLINGRFMASFMLPASWPRLLAECRRLLTAQTRGNHSPDRDRGAADQ
jgi:ubiquinone/menaquinone biosynthesis C-methylase UbiE